MTTRQEDHIRRSVMHFSDPGSEVDVSPVTQLDDAFHVEWTLRGYTRQAILYVDPSSRNNLSSEEHTDKKTYFGLKAFLASSDLADLHSMAHNTLRVIDKDDFYISTTARVRREDESDYSSELAESAPVVEIINSLAKQRAEYGTLIPFLTAPAGVGKTTVLKKLVRDSAEGYLAGRSAPLWIYVNAQGKRLANLSDAIASYLDDIRSGFSYSAMSSLVRCGAVALVVDGFDELLGTADSYDEAFGSLSSFVEELDGEGMVVAAARSTYYEQEFRSRAGKTTGFDAGTWDLRVVVLDEWTESQRDQFVGMKISAVPASDREAALSRINKVLSSADIGAFANRPFFVNRLVDLAIDNDLGSDYKPALELMVDSYLEREASKFKSPGGSLMSKEWLDSLYGEIAEEMWKQETRELGNSTVRELVEILTEGILGAEAQKIVIERVPYSAVLVSGTTSGSASFEHELYFFYFLASRIAEAVNSKSTMQLRSALRRGRLPNDAARMLAPKINIQPRDLFTLFSDSTRSSAPDLAFIRSNSGTVCAAFLQNAQSTVSNVSIEGIDFFDVSFEAVTFSSVHISRCQFSGVNFTGSLFLDCSASGVTFSRIVVDARSTRLEIGGMTPVDVSGVRDVRDINFVYDVNKSRDLLSKVGLGDFDDAAPDLRNIHKDVYEAISTMVDIFRNTNIMTESDQFRARKLSSLTSWDTVRDAALSAGVLKEKKKPASGTKTFYQIHALPSDLLKGFDLKENVPGTVKIFWDLLEEKH